MQSFNFVMTGKKEELNEKPLLPQKKAPVKRNKTLSECSTDHDEVDSLFTDIKENEFEYEESEDTPQLEFQESVKVDEIMTILKKEITALTCPCKRQKHNISDEKAPLTQAFIDDKMGQLNEVQEQLSFLECTCQSGDRIAIASLEHIKEVMAKIDALGTDYQDRFKEERPAFKRQKQNLRGRATSNENVTQVNIRRPRQAKRLSSIAEIKRLAYSRVGTNSLLFQQH